MDQQITLDVYERLQPNMAYHDIKFLTPNKHCAWRVDTLDTKEPDTIAWLAKMQPGEVLYDVGANMGQYSLIAAARGLTVHAFEPESQNFALLMRNIYLNDMGDRVTAWPLCLSDEAMLDTFHVQSLVAGGSCSSFHDEVNFHLQPKKYAVHQGSFGLRMDAFSVQFGDPDHVKIDVDGLEHKVVDGMGYLLKNIKSVLVEINTGLTEHTHIYDVMAENGLFPDVETAQAARRKEGAFEGIGNVIFYRGKP